MLIVREPGAVADATGSRLRCDSAATITAPPALIAQFIAMIEATGISTIRTGQPGEPLIA